MNPIKKLGIIIMSFGFDPRQFLFSLKGILPYSRDFFLLYKQLKYNNDFKIKSLFPALSDRYMESGIMTGHYFHQDLYVAQKIYQNNPQKHIDIGSRVDGFVAHIATFRKIKIFDIRKINSKIENIEFEQVDFMNPLNDMYIESVDSISCLHTLEHFGLGRYGDKIDVNGHIKGLENIYKLLTKGGIFYFSVPIGNQRIEFNAHRVFNISYLIKMFETHYTIEEFSYINDSGDFIKSITLNEPNISSNYGCNYGCGIFVLRKK